MLTRAERDARIVNNLDELATQTGRLLRRLSSSDTGATSMFWAVKGIADRVECLHSFFEPTAAEIVACTFPGDPATVDEALRIVEARTHALQARLGLDAAAAVLARECRDRRADELTAA